MEDSRNGLTVNRRFMQRLISVSVKGKYRQQEWASPFWLVSVESSRYRSRWELTKARIVSFVSVEAMINTIKRAKPSPWKFFSRCRRAVEKCRSRDQWSILYIRAAQLACLPGRYGQSPIAISVFFARLRT